MTPGDATPEPPPPRPPKKPLETEEILNVVRTRPRLDRDAILAAALRIIDESGLEACTMRAVAADLGVEAMSLYWHVAGRGGLMEGVVDRVLLQVQAEQGPVSDWQSAFLAFARAFRDVIGRHPNVLPLIAGRSVGSYAAGGEATDRALRLLEEAGFDRHTAIRAVRTMGRFVVGSALIEMSVPPGRTPAQDHPGVAELIDARTTDDPAALFLFGLHAVIDGLKAQLRRA